MHTPFTQDAGLACSAKLYELAMLCSVRLPSPTFRDSLLITARPQTLKLSGRTLRKLPIKAKMMTPSLYKRGRQGRLVHWVAGMQKAVEEMARQAEHVQAPVGFEE